MASAERNLVIYRELADCYDNQGLPQLRDRFLVLAADAAQTAGQPEEAERLRRHLLQLSPHHMLKPFASFAEALRSPDVQSYLKDLKQGYPPETVAGLLESLRAGNPEAAVPPADPLDAPQATLAPRPGTQMGDDVPRVYPLRKEPQQPSSPPTRALPPRKPPLAAPAWKGGTAAPAPRPAAPPPRVPAPAVPRPTRMGAGEPSGVVEAMPVAREVQPGAWVASLVFVLVFLLGVGILGYTLARPFLPAEWLPPG